MENRLFAAGFKDGQTQTANLPGNGDLSGSNAFTLVPGRTYVLTIGQSSPTDDFNRADVLTLKYGTDAPANILDGISMANTQLPWKFRALAGQTNLSVASQDASATRVSLAEEF